MEPITYKRNLDLHKQGAQICINAQRGDVKSILRFTFSEGGKSYPLDDATVLFAAAKPDGNYLYNSCTVEDNAAVYQFTEQTTPVIGPVVCQFQILDEDGKVKYSPSFILLVSDNAYNGQAIIDSTTEATALSEYMSHLMEMLANGDFKGEKGDPDGVWDNGWYGVRAAQTAESYLQTRHLGVNFPTIFGEEGTKIKMNYKYNGIFNFHEAVWHGDGDDDTADTDISGDDEEGEEGTTVGGIFDGYDPSTVTGYRMWDYASEPPNKTPTGQGDYKNEISVCMDCSTFISLVLRGIPFENSPWINYGQQIIGDQLVPKYTWEPKHVLDLYGEEGWEQDIDHEPAGKYNDIGIDGYSSLRTAADIAEYYYTHGKVLYDRIIRTPAQKDLNNPKFEDIMKIIRPGDLIFWSRTKNNNTEMKQPDRFRCVSHIAMVSTNTNKTIEVTQSTTLPSAVYALTLKQSRMSAISLIIRPDYRPIRERHFKDYVTPEIPYNTNLLVYPWTFSFKHHTVKEETGGHILNRLSYPDGSIRLTQSSAASNYVMMGIKGRLGKFSDSSWENCVTLTPGRYRLSGMDDSDIPVSTTGFAFRLHVWEPESGWQEYNSTVRYASSLSDGELVSPTTVEKDKVRCYHGSHQYVEFYIWKTTHVRVVLYIGTSVGQMDCTVTPTLEKVGDLSDVSLPGTHYDPELVEVPETGGAADTSSSEFKNIQSGHMFTCTINSEPTYWLKTGASSAVRLALYSDLEG